ncbi:MAG: FliO/MopB family protein [Planctomycetaceae bacterium]
MPFRIRRVSWNSMLLASWLLACSSLQAQQPDDLPQATITRSSFTPVPLRPVEKVSQVDRDAASNTAGSRTSAAPLVTVGSSLAIVLGLFAALVWVSKRASKNSAGNRELPDDALRILGKKSMGTSGSIAMIRCGRSVFIVGIHSSGMQRLGEITDDDEVRHLEALCTGQSKASFDQTLAEMQREPIKRGFIGEDVQHAPATRRHKLFATS